jgi:hypothetical protein
VREATSFGTAFIRAENGSSRPGHSRENNCQVLRPSRVSCGHLAAMFMVTRPLVPGLDSPP